MRGASLKHTMSTSQKSRFSDITFERLLVLPGVSGAILTESGRRVHSETKLDPTLSAHLADLARNLCRGYRRVRRVPTKIVLAFDRSALLIASRDDTQLVLLLESSVDLDTISSAASAFLAKRTERPLRLPSSKLPAA